MSTFFRFLTYLCGIGLNLSGPSAFHTAGIRYEAKISKSKRREKFKAKKAKKSENMRIKISLHLR